MSNKRTLLKKFGRFLFVALLGSTLLQNQSVQAESFVRTKNFLASRGRVLNCAALASILGAIAIRDGAKADVPDLQRKGDLAPIFRDHAETLSQEIARVTDFFKKSNNAPVVVHRDHFPEIRGETVRFQFDLRKIKEALSHLTPSQVNEIISLYKAILITKLEGRDLFTDYKKLEGLVAAKDADRGHFQSIADQATQDFWYYLRRSDPQTADTLRHVLGGKKIVEVSFSEKNHSNETNAVVRYERRPRNEAFPDVASFEELKHEFQTLFYETEIMRRDVLKRVRASMGEHAEKLIAVNESHGKKVEVLSVDFNAYLRRFSDDRALLRFLKGRYRWPDGVELDPELLKDIRQYVANAAVPRPAHVYNESQIRTVDYRTMGSSVPGPVSNVGYRIIADGKNVGADIMHEQQAYQASVLSRADGNMLPFEAIDPERVVHQANFGPAILKMNMAQATFIAEMKRRGARVFSTGDETIAEFTEKPADIDQILIGQSSRLRLTGGNKEEAPEFLDHEPDVLYHATGWRSLGEWSQKAIDNHFGASGLPELKLFVDVQTTAGAKGRDTSYEMRILYQMPATMASTPKSQVRAALQHANLMNTLREAGLPEDLLSLVTKIEAVEINALGTD